MDSGNILLNSPKIQQLIATPSSFVRLKIDANINCCPEVFHYDQPLPLTSTTPVEITPDGLLIKPQFFLVTPPEKIRDGVYHFEVKLFTDANNYSFEEGCAFIDITYKCKVASYIDKVLDTTSEDGQCATQIMILHYSLTIAGDDCSCNCLDMCNVFKELTKLINPVQPQMQSCGC